jgi:hypothetical protein
MVLHWELEILPRVDAGFNLFESAKPEGNFLMALTATAVF